MSAWPRYPACRGTGPLKLTRWPGLRDKEINFLGPSFYLPLRDLGGGAVDTAVGSSAGSGTPTFTRATTATTTDKTGKIVTVASGVARSCYDPATLEYLGYLSEEQRTNLALWSADLSNAVWSAQQVTIGGSVTLPDGTTGTVNKIQENTASSQHDAGPQVGRVGG